MAFGTGGHCVHGDMWTCDTWGTWGHADMGTWGTLGHVGMRDIGTIWDTGVHACPRCIRVDKGDTG